MKLSDRVRGGSEAAPWVVEAITKLEDAVMAEREACAKICSDIHFKYGMYEVSLATVCADEIRKRGTLLTPASYPTTTPDAMASHAMSG